MQKVCFKRPTLPSLRDHTLTPLFANIYLCIFAIFVRLGCCKGADRSGRPAFPHIRIRPPILPNHRRQVKSQHVHPPTPITGF